MDTKAYIIAYLSAPIAITCWIVAGITLNARYTDHTVDAEELFTTTTLCGVTAVIATMLFIIAILAHREMLNQQLISALTDKTDADETTPPPPESGS